MYRLDSKKAELLFNKQFVIEDHAPPLDLSYSTKLRSFQPETIIPDDKMLVLEAPTKQASFMIEEVSPETDLEKIYMEIACQSRRNNWLYYNLKLKLAHLNVLEGARPLIDDVLMNPLHDTSCRDKNRREYELFYNKIKRLSNVNGR